MTVEYKEFGVRLTFTPTIAGDVIRLKVRPEVSTLDFANGITLSGFRIPRSRLAAPRPTSSFGTDSRSRLRVCSTTWRRTIGAAIPILGKIPIIGYLFQSKAERTERTELMVLITPRLVRPLDPDEVPPLPTFPGKFLDEQCRRRDGGRRHGGRAVARYQEALRR